MVVHQISYQDNVVDYLLVGDCSICDAFYTEPVHKLQFSATRIARAPMQLKGGSTMCMRISNPISWKEALQMFRRARNSFHSSILHHISRCNGITDGKDQDLLLRALELGGHESFVIFCTAIAAMLKNWINASSVIRSQFTSKGDVVNFLFPAYGRISNVVQIIAVPGIDSGLVLTGNGEPYQIASRCRFREFGYAESRDSMRQYFERTEDWRWITLA